MNAKAKEEEKEPQGEVLEVKVESTGYSVAVNPNASVLPDKETIEWIEKNDKREFHPCHSGGIPKAVPPFCVSVTAGEDGKPFMWITFGSQDKKLFTVPSTVIKSRF